MELAEIKILIDRYYDGETTLAEEVAIADYFATHADIPAELEPTRAIFMATTALREQKAPHVAPRAATPYRRLFLHFGGIAAAAAIAVGVFLGLRHESAVEVEQHPLMLCYIDGVAVDDQEVIIAEANRILGGVSEDMQMAMAKIEALNISAIR